MLKQTPAHNFYNESLFNSLLSIQPTNVIEVGCMRGILAKEYLKHNPNSTWTGIDIDIDNVIKSKENCTQAIYGNIEEMDFIDIPNIDKVDCWVFGDVLEHLYNPWRILKKIKKSSPNHCKVIACIPNSQHWSFQVRVNAGMWQYQDEGLFDRTHIRFFSRDTIISMFNDAGFTITSMYARNFQFEGYQKYLPIIRDMASLTGVDPDQAESDAMAFQFVVEAVM